MPATFQDPLGLETVRDDPLGIDGRAGDDPLGLEHQPVELPADEFGIGEEVRGFGRALNRGGRQFLQGINQRDIQAVGNTEDRLKQLESLLASPYAKTHRNYVDWRREAEELNRRLPGIVAQAGMAGGEFSRQEEAIGALPPTTAQAEFQKPETPWWGFFKNPAELAALTLAESAPVMTATVAAAPAGPLGVAAAAGAGSFAAESTGRIKNAMTEAGVDLRKPEQVMAWFSDRARSDPAIAKAELAALGPAGFDTLSGGLAGQLLKRAIGKGAIKVVKATGGEMVLQMAGGGAGSLAGSALANEPVDWKDFVLEVAGEFAPGEAVSNVWAARRLARSEKTVPAADDPLGLKNRQSAIGNQPSQPASAPRPQTVPDPGLLPKPPAGAPAAQAPAGPTTEVADLTAAVKSLEATMRGETAQSPRLRLPGREMAAELRQQVLADLPPDIRAEIEAREAAAVGPSAELTPPPAGAIKPPGAAAETITGQNEQKGSEARAATTLAAQPMPAEVQPAAQVTASTAATPTKAPTSPAFTPEPGKIVYVRLRDHLNKLHKARVIKVQPDGETQVLFMAGPHKGKYQTLKRALVQEPKSAVTRRLTAAEFGTRPESERAQAKKDARQFKELVGQHGQAFGWYNPEAEHGAADTQGGGIAAGNELNAGIARAFAALQLPGTPASPLDRARGLARLKEHLGPRLLADEQAREFEQRIVRGERPEHESGTFTGVRAEVFRAGDRFEGQGMIFTVDAVMFDEAGQPESLVLKDGPKFGQQRVGSDEVLHVDKESVDLGPEHDAKPAAMPQSALRAPEKFSLAENFQLGAPETVAERQGVGQRDVQPQAKMEAVRKIVVAEPGGAGGVEVSFRPEWKQNGRIIQGQFFPNLGRIEINAAAPGMDDPATVRRVVREERAHQLLSSREGRALVRQFALNRMTPAAEAQLRAQGYTGSRESLADEFIAKQAREQTAWWKALVERVRAWLAEKGLAKLSPEETARAILRSLKSGVQSLESGKLRAGNATVDTRPGLVTIGGPDAMALTAYHGTPHNVDKFTTAKIGTGEGAQVYGWGLYFAENPQVAKEYARQLGGHPRVEVGGRTVDANQDNAVSRVAAKIAEQRASYDYLGKNVTDGQAIASARENIISFLETAQAAGDSKVIRRLTEELAALKNMEAEGLGIKWQKKEYTVTLNVEPEDLLDWDKPLSQQSEKVRKAMEYKPYSPHGNPGANETGNQLYRRISDFYQEGLGQDPRPKTSEHLSRLGIRGIRYLDQGSRNKAILHIKQGTNLRGDPRFTVNAANGDEHFDTRAEAQAFINDQQNAQTYNYVIFDQNDITITHENGQPVALETLDSSLQNSDSPRRFSLSDDLRDKVTARSERAKAVREQAFDEAARRPSEPSPVPAATETPAEPLTEAEAPQPDARYSLAPKNPERGEVRGLLRSLDSLQRALLIAKRAGNGLRMRELGKTIEAAMADLNDINPKLVREVTRELIEAGEINQPNTLPPKTEPKKMLLRSGGAAKEYLAPEEPTAPKPAAAPQPTEPSAAPQPESDPQFAEEQKRAAKLGALRTKVYQLRKLMAGPPRTESQTAAPAPTPRELPAAESQPGGEPVRTDAALAQVRKMEAQAEEYLARLEHAKAAGEQNKKRGTPETLAQWVRARDEQFAREANHIRQSLLQLARALPADERSKFTAAISAAMRRPRILSGNLETMYERAAAVAAEIESHIEAVREYANRADNIRDHLRSMLKELPAAERGKYLGAFAVAMRDPTSKFTGKLLADVQAHIDYVTEFDTRAEAIRAGLKDLLMELPLAERGRFSTGLAGALRQPTSKFAAKFAARVEAHIEDVWKYDTIQQIKKVAARALESPTVDIRFKRMVSTLLQRLAVDQAGEGRLDELHRIQEQFYRMKAAGADVFVPEAILQEMRVLAKNRLQDLPTEALDALWSKLVIIEKAGRQANASRIQLLDMKRLDLEKDLAAATTNPQNERATSDETRLAGTKTTALTRIADQVARLVNAARNLDRAVLPIDALFDVLDGTATGGGPNYRGVFARRFKGTVRLNRQRELVLRDEIAEELVAIRKKHKLTTRNGERIGVYALLQQEGVRERLLAQGETAANLNQIVSSITPGELEFYHAARALMEKYRPQIADLMHRLYNVELKPEKNYWPLQRDWQKYAKDATPQEAAKLVESGGAGGFDELGTWQDLSPDYRGYLRTKLEQGFTRERTKGMTPVKVNAFEVLEQHFRAVTHLLAHQEDLKILGEVARDDLMKEKAGAVGQKIVLDWLDTVARDGRVDGHQRNRFVDALRRSLTIGIIPFNPVTMLVHTSQIPVTMSLIGPNWFRRGAMALLTPEGKKFVRDNMRTLLHRSGSEAAISEVQRGGHPLINLLFGEESVPARAVQAYTKAGTWPIRMIDTIHSMTAAVGAYQRELAKKGINPDDYATHPVDQEALGHAMAISHRTVASVLPEDMPQVLTRGKSILNKSGNVSFAKTILHFGNTYLDIWSVIRHDFAGRAIPEIVRGRDTRSLWWAGSLGVAIVLSLLWEAGIRFGIRQAIAGALDVPPKEDDEYSHEVAHELLKRFPFMGNAMATRYGDTGIPVLDTGVQLGKDLYHRGQVKTDDAKLRATARIATDIGTMAGIPGASFGGRLLQKSLIPPSYNQLDAMLDDADRDGAWKVFNALVAAGHTAKAIEQHYRTKRKGETLEEREAREHRQTVLASFNF